MANYTMEYSENRGTWNIYDTDNHEWYAEGTFEQMSTMMDNMFCEDDDYYGDDGDEEWEEVDPDEYSGNCHCDTYGVCGGTSCRNYFQCQGA